FAAHPEILAAWYRLLGVAGYGPIRDSDVMLLHHELHELMLVDAGEPHDKAHEAAHKKYPWADMVGLSTRRHGSLETSVWFYGAATVSATPVRPIRKRRRTEPDAEQTAVRKSRRLQGSPPVDWTLVDTGLGGLSPRERAALFAQAGGIARDAGL